MSNQLDDFFKNKLQERTFEYDESAWEDARLLIEKDERSKKKRYLFFWFAGLSILMLVGISAYYLGKFTAAPNHTPEYNESSKQTIDTDETKIIANSDYNNSNLKTINDNDAVVSHELLIASNENDFIISSTSTSVDDAASSVTNTKNSANKNKTTITENNKKNSFNRVNAQGVASTTTTTYKPTTVDTNPNIVNKVAPELYQNQKNVDEVSSLENLSDFVQMPLLDLNNFSESNETSDDFFARHPASLTGVEGSPLVDPSQKFFFGIRGGMALIPLKFMDFEAGIELAYQINRNWSIALQPKYQYQSLAQNTLGETKVTEFGFGLRSSAFSLEAETIRSIHLPLVLSYSFGGRSLDLADKLSGRYLKNKVSFGAAYIMVDGITGTVFQSEGQGQSSVLQTGWLAARTYHEHNAELMIGYDRYLSQRFSLGLQARYRVRDQFTDVFTESNQDIVAPNAFYLGLQANFKIF